MTAKKRARGRSVEWIGGLGMMRAHVTGEGAPYRPQVLAWMDERGLVRGIECGRPEEIMALAAASLRNAIEQPLAGPTLAPSRVRVASPELAAALRVGLPSIEVVCAPTPEIDAILEDMAERFGAGSEAPRSYLGPDIAPDAVASFFRAAAALYRAAPWKKVPGDQDLIAVTVERFDVHDAVLSVLGGMGMSYGLLFFGDFTTFEGFIDACEARQEGDDAIVPGHLALNFERGADLQPSLRQEIAEHGWEVAGRAAYPWLMATDDGLAPRPASVDELAIVEAVALALIEFLADLEPLRRAWQGGDPVTRSVSVRTHAGEIEVTLSMPHGGRARELESGDERISMLDGAAQSELLIDLLRAVVAAGTQAGFDMNDPADLDAWMQVVATQGLPVPSRSERGTRGGRVRNKKKAEKRARPKR